MQLDPQLTSRDFEALRTRLCRKSLKYFISQAWHIVEPDSELLWNWHLDVICAKLEDLTFDRLLTHDGKPTRKAIFNIPPGTGKSVVISVMWPAWEWCGVIEEYTDDSGHKQHRDITKAGALRYLTASYGSELSVRDNLSVRDIVTSTWYKSRFWPEIEISKDQSGKTRYNTTARGWRIATSPDGKGTGEHPDREIIDDPHKAKEALSDVSLSSVVVWDETTLSTRKARNPIKVLVMQRLSEKDLAATRLQKGGYYHLLLPMRYEKPSGKKDTTTNKELGRWACACHQKPDPNDIRTKPGELLFPALWPEDKLADSELELGEFGTSGQMQQRPVSPFGGMFKREWFNFVEAYPLDVTWCRGWDTAATEDAGDYTAGVKLGWSLTTKRYYIISSIRAQVADADIIIEGTAISDGRSCKIREETEGGSSGKKVIASHRLMLAGYDFDGVQISGSKATRARPFRKDARAGNVDIVVMTRQADGSYIYTGEWAEPYLAELCGRGKNDDQIDATSCAFNAIALEVEKAVKRGGAWGRKAMLRRRRT